MDTSTWYVYMTKCNPMVLTMQDDCDKKLVGNLFWFHIKFWVTFYAVGYMKYFCSGEKISNPLVIKMYTKINRFMTKRILKCIF